MHVPYTTMYMFTMYMCKVLIKNIFGKGIKFTHCFAIYRFNIHYTRLHILKKLLKHNFSVLILSSKDSP